MGEGGRRRRRRKKRRFKGTTAVSERTYRVPLKVVAVSLALALAVSPLLFGGAFGYSVVIASVMGVVLLALVARIDEGVPRKLGVVGTLLLIGLAYTGLQLLPLPFGLIESLAPDSAEAARRAHAIVGSGAPSWATLTLDPGATRIEVLKGFALCGAFFAALTLARREERRLAAYGVAAAVGVVAIVTLAHVAVGLRKVYGIYLPTFNPELVGPLLNVNHLGGLMAFGAPLFVGLALDNEEAPRKLLWFGAAAVCVGLVVASFSRGAFAALALAALIFVVLMWTRSSKRAGGKSRAIAVGAAAVGMVVVAMMYVGLETVLPRLAERDVSKIDGAIRGLDVFFTHTAFGVGRGAFSAAFVSLYGGVERWAYPENIVVQWLSEWGLLGGVLLLGFGFALVKALRRARTPLRIGAVAGVCAIATQNLVDYSLEMSGVAMIVVAGLAVALVERSKDGEPSPHVTRATALTALVGVAMLALFASAAWEGNATERTRRIAARVKAAKPETVELNTASLLLHPAEPNFYLLGGSLAIAKQDPRALKWVTGAMTLAPTWGGPHLVAAQALWARGRRDQAMLEVREAERLHPAIAKDFMCEVVRISPEVRWVERAAPETDARGAFLDRSAACLPSDSPLAAEIDALLSNDDALPPRVVARRAERLVREGDRQGAAALLEGALEESPEDANLVAGALRLYAKLEDAARGDALLDAMPPELSANVQVLRARCELEAALGREDGLRESASALRGLSTHSSTKLAAGFVFEGEMFERMGRPNEALKAYAEAARIHPDGDARARSAALAEREGQLRRALHGFTQLCARAGGRGPHCDAKDRVSARIERDRALVQP